MDTIQLLMNQDQIPTQEEFEQLLSAANNEADFGNLAIDLAGAFASVVQDAIALSESRAGRDEGILRGLAVRTIKLLDRLANELSQGHGDVEMLYIRLLDDTIVTLGYLLIGGKEAFDQFVYEATAAQRERRRANR